MNHNVLISSYLQSDFFGKTIIIGLFFLSIYAWAIICMKMLLIKDTAKKKAQLFQMLNRSQGDILSGYQRGNPLPNAPFQNLYEAICSELQMMMDANSRAGKPRKLTTIQMDNLFELSDCTISNQTTNMEKYLITLATIVSISPLLGLLGTVWGILVSFSSIGRMGSATLAVVAPGMAEALVTTVAGLLVAIPALIGYNWVTNKIQVTTRELENFSTRILSYIQSLYGISGAYEKEPTYQ